MQNKFDILQEYFGYDFFRIGQEEIIDHLINGGDAVAVMPTGAGKSLCFQVPALMFDGITLVISPLVSLMKDQVNALTQSGVKAAYLNSSLTPGQYKKALANAANGLYKIIYVAPERLFAEDFLSFALNAKISMLTIDEAHCISQWGQDFRPSYLQIPQFIAALPSRPVVSAFTATATIAVRKDIQSHLALHAPLEVVTGFDRPNLYFEVRAPKDKSAELLGILSADESRDKSAIIYCSTRKAVEQICQMLCDNGYSATQYHAGLPDDERQRNQDNFILDKRPIIVATNAFGMGIDKSNVSLVVHYNMPKNLESYYQEAGRAGRDGECANCILLYSGQDVILNQYLIKKGAEESEQLDEALRAEIYARDANRLKSIVFYCTTTNCLRGYLLRYFGEQSPGFCGNCYNCNNNFEEFDITLAAQKILSCVNCVGEKYGLRLVIDVLRGINNQRIEDLNLDKQSTYGILSEMNENRLRQIILHLELENFLLVTDGKYPVLKLGPRADEILQEQIPLLIKLPKEAAPKEASPKEKTKKSTAPKRKDVEAVEVDKNLFDLLREVRAKIASEQHVPPYIVFSNATLTDMCKVLPKTDEEFLTVSGVGKTKLERYGARFLEAIAQSPTPLI